MKLKTMLGALLLALILWGAVQATPCDYPTAITTISGRVTNSAGTGLAGVTVMSLSSDSHEVCDSVFTSVSGYYTLPAVYAPSYVYIRATKKFYISYEQLWFIYSPMDEVNITLTQ